MNMEQDTEKYSPNEYERKLLICWLHGKLCPEITLDDVEWDPKYEFDTTRPANIWERFDDEWTKNLLKKLDSAFIALFPINVKK